jgi:protein-S-isoprenylcysteine O-methyltransferase Ste14
VSVDPFLIVRAGSIYLATAFTLVLWVWRRPSPGVMAGAVLAFFLNVPVVLAVSIGAAQLGWWQFTARGGLLLGVPVDLLLSWAWLWSVVPALAFPSLPLAAIAIIVMAADVVLMPFGAPVITLGSRWMIGEAVGVVAGVVPGQLLARWTARREHVAGRATLQALTFAALVMFILPAAVIEGSGTTWLSPIDVPAWKVSLALHALAVPAVIGLTAVQEFATRGGGTPVPFDPPQRLVTSGIYSYVANPMQLSAVLLLLVLGFELRNMWVSAAGVMAHLYSAGFAGWDEHDDLRRRFGSDWELFRRNVPRWRPRYRPWHRDTEPSARLFVANSCGMCRQVGTWFADRGARHLEIVPAETHPSRALTRITYESGDGTFTTHGVDAVARALEHLHFWWALAAFVLRLPIASHLAQLLADASGAQPRRIPLDVP